MFFGPDLYSPGTHECECVSGIEPASTVSPSCTTPGQYQWYIRAAPEPAQPEASLTRKRRQEAVVRRAAEQDTTLCPSTLTPCRIKGSDDGWEVRRLSLRNLDVLRSRLLTPLLSSLRQCIDTQTELESCGGCRHGVFTTNKIQKTAVLPARLQRRQPTLSLPSSAAAGLLSVGVEYVPLSRSRSPHGLTLCVPYCSSAVAPTADASAPV
jgi:hypothetical protein